MYQQKITGYPKSNEEHASNSKMGGEAQPITSPSQTFFSHHQCEQNIKKYSNKDELTINDLVNISSYIYSCRQLKQLFSIPANINLGIYAFQRNSLYLYTFLEHLYNILESQTQELCIMLFGQTFVACLCIFWGLSLIIYNMSLSNLLFSKVSLGKEIKVKLFNKDD